MKKLFISSGIILLLFSLSIEHADSIPAFARKYRMSCTTCHSPGAPKLKPYGDDFAGAGFKLSDQESPRYYVETGDSKLSLIRNFPLAVRLDGHLTYNNGNREKSDFGAPFLLKLLSGGEISEHLAYYFYAYIDERGEVAGIEDAYIMYDNLFDSELDIYLGQFQVSDPLFKRELRLTLEDYKIYTSTPGMSNINMKYDKGVMFTYGFNTGTDVIVEVLNGNGLNEANENHIFDKDKYKNVLGRVSQDIGDYFRIGAFAYYGKEKILTGDDSGELTNKVFMWGPDFTFSYKDNFELNVQYLTRTDEKNWFAGQAQNNIQTQGGLVEMVYSPKGEQSNWYLAALGNYVDSDLDYLDYKSATLHAGYLLRRNLRLVGEVSYNFTDTDNAYPYASIGFVSAF